MAEPLDLRLDEDDDLVVTSDLEFTSGLKGVHQNLLIRLRWFKGEWFLNQDEGVPYFQEILGHKYNELRIRSAFRRVITRTPHVQTINRLALDFDRPTRTLTVSFRVTTDFGSIEDTLEVAA